MKNSHAFLDCFDQDCLNLAANELVLKYPKTPSAELIESQRIIKEQMSELNQRRFRLWLKKKPWVLYSFGED
mgnify:CR=1 FL=1